MWDEELQAWAHCPDEKETIKWISKNTNWQRIDLWTTVVPRCGLTVFQVPLNDMAKISDDDKRTFLEVVNENIKIIRELGLNADEVRARFGLLPLEESAPKGTWDESDLVPNPE